MAAPIQKGECVKLPDGRIARVRGTQNGKYKVRVRRTTSLSHQFLFFEAGQLERIDCPKGWMSPAGYNRYVRITLAKMKLRKPK
jgi:hypothetical protein